MTLVKRPRRLRATETIRALVRETRVSKDALVYPLFVRWGASCEEPLPSLPGQTLGSPDRIPFLFEEAYRKGVRGVLLFGLPEQKDATGSSAWDARGPVPLAIKELKRAYPDVTVITDVCLCEYTDHGHCGVIRDGRIDNDRTLPLLAAVSVSHAEAGADIVAPSDMMDGRVAAIRSALDREDFQDTAIMSYAVKYASAFYGPFRYAAGSAPSFGDRKSYQMDPHNSDEAIREAELDAEEGADILIVKPGFAYHDILYRVAQRFSLPVASYSVSGEYAMIKAGAAAGAIDEAKIVCETSLSAFRAGADILITYFAPALAGYIDEGRL
jgi:porphobilinogen synthase